MSAYAESEQLQMPLLVPLSCLRPSVRFDAFEEQLLAQLKARTGFSRSDIIRRALQVVKLEVAQCGGSADFLLNPERFEFPSTVRRVTSGRKPRGRKIAELRKTIAASLRALESQRRELEALEAREVRAA